MSEIMLKAADAKDAANAVVQGAEDAQADFDALKTKLSSLSDSFRGQAATAWEENYESWETNAKELVSALESLGKFLNGAADTIEETDRNIASNLKG